MSGVFDGLRVIDCSSFIAAPGSTTVLSDFGADVIKIEPPGAGDPGRGIARLPGTPKGDHNYGWLLEQPTYASFTGYGEVGAEASRHEHRQLTRKRGDKWN